ncbi:sulfotransferase family protein [Actinomadura rugatobispora]|uniref:Sulfotransferase family protein n=1 Tax=Actinomadura rugatobispora TaxID=1994 RepID=A0ABW1A9A0_9ACTN|nr:sulfotransferase [Actinomadura rugatobispora]
MVSTSELLIDRARERTGLADLGPDGWQEGLDRLLAAVPVDIGSDPRAAEAIETIILGRLVNRLRIEHWYARHDEAEIPRVEGPVVILGLPRTGTTALHYLLAVDPRFRYLRAWESGDPVPPPVAATESDDPRRAAANGRGNVRHIKTVDGPVEDVGPLGLHFHNQDLLLPLPSYTRWWRDADLTSTFAYHERVLRLLHSHSASCRWLLKAPAYLFQVARLAERYPDVRFVMTHRDPAVALASACSTVASSQKGAVPARVQDPRDLGRDLLEHFAEGTLRAIAERRRLGEERFLDVGQHEIENDPLGAAERIYDFLGLALTAQVRAAMAAWAAANRRGDRGRHVYAPEDFGLSAERIRRAFGGYIDRFGALTGIAA